MTKPFYRKPLSFLLSLLLLMESLFKAILALILPSKPKSTRRTYPTYDSYKRPTGYKFQDENGKWHYRWWIYNQPPR